MMISKKVYLFLLQAITLKSINATPFEQKSNGKPTCGYEKCYLGEEGMLNVHLVPHTHDDVGWVRSVDEYFYEDVQFILDTVSNELKNDAKKRFIYVEMAFFYRWWRSLDDKKKKDVKLLVNNGQLEFILGGWSMNDEASTHYSAIIDQHTVGFDFLKSTFGECGIPKIGWQIDPFGHSREQASLFAQFGFDGLFFARLDYQDYKRRKNYRNLEHVWFGSASLGDQASLFTGALYNMSYRHPNGFCFECEYAPIRDDPDLDGYNLKAHVDRFLSVAIEQKRHFKSNHIMWTMGGNFHYKNARMNFKNIEKIIKAVNKLQEKGRRINAFFSTPSCYLYALNKANLTYEPKTDDFFPYAHREHSFWTGYFTSRPTLKGYERSSNNFLQVCKQLQLLSGVPEQEKVLYFKRVMGVLQHHNAITGTANRFVTKNYIHMLSTGTRKCQDVVAEALSLLMQKSLNPPKSKRLDFTFCNLLNVSYCRFTESSTKFAMVIYNPLGTKVKDHVRIPLKYDQYQVLDAFLHPVEAQFLSLSYETKHLPEHKASKAIVDLVFPVSLPALGYTTYYIFAPEEFSETFSFKPLNRKLLQYMDDNVFITNEFLKITFNTQTGLMETIENKEKSIKINATQNFYFYQSMPGNNEDGPNQASGAYVFRPKRDIPLPITTEKVKISVIKGKVVEEVRQVFSPWASMVVRLYKGAKHFETEWTIGPIPRPNRLGREVISRFDTSIDSHDTFYTDANGRELLKRRKDYRETWDLEQTEPVAGNYYPVNSRILIKSVSKDVQFSVLNDRSQGGSSLASGQVELMLHRRLFFDDSLGLGESLDEIGKSRKGLIARGKHYVILDTKEDSTEKHRTLARQLYMSPYSAFIPLNSFSPNEFESQFTTFWSGINANKLPANVHILSLEEWHDKQILIRLEHFYEKGEHSKLSKDASVSLNDLFAPDKVVWLKETTLGANKDLSSSTRLTWNVKGKGKTQSKMSSFVTPVEESTMTVHLKAMQIRTFLIKLSSRA